METMDSLLSVNEPAARLDLNGLWSLRAPGEQETVPAPVPGTVAGALLAAGKIPDPYFGKNEELVQPALEKDYVFSRSFTVPAELLAHQRVTLRCDGLDTLAAIRLNGEQIAETDNMHRRWRFDVKEKLRPGENTIEVEFASPRTYKEVHPNVLGMFPPSLRKASCMFGWDWGLTLPDSGIWRDISLEAFDAGRIRHVQIGQRHENGRVFLTVEPVTELWGDDARLEYVVRAPDGQPVLTARGPRAEGEIPQPRLWYPVGMGEQTLYTVEVTLLQGDTPVHRVTRQIGLRTVALDRGPTPDGGRDYSFSVNGQPVYIRGQALIIEDAFLGRSTPARWQRLVDYAVRSNLNCIRVWGGAYYPPELFFALCDRAGILVYMDFMFACSPFPGDDAFLENVRVEAEQNVQMMHSHPSLLLLCGNNEIEVLARLLFADDPALAEMRRQFGGDGSPMAPPEAVAQFQADYERLFDGLLRDVCARLAPEIPFVRSSPSLEAEPKTGDMAEFYTLGDMHFYLQYMGNLPYQSMEQIPARFLSEVGFESHPSYKTLQAICPPEELRKDSPTMAAHQKCKNGNEVIEEYMGRDFRIPEDFEHYVYLSQLSAAQIMKFTSDTYRRQCGFNRGTIIWQYNDCWPVISWAGVDYFGRWKAMQYYIRRFFAPVLALARLGEDKAELWLCNQSAAPFSGNLRWRLCDAAGRATAQGECPATAGVYESVLAGEVPLASLTEEDRKDLHLEYRLLDAQGRELSLESALLCPAKEHRFQPAAIDLQVQETPEGWVVTLTADRWAHAVMLDTRAGDALFSDNWMTLPAGEPRTVTLRREDTDLSSTQELRRQLFTLSLNQVMTDAK